MYIYDAPAEAVLNPKKKVWEKLQVIYIDR